ncbi:transglutaminase family protein [Phormidium tenue]|uniref:Transglutaminase n=1 Tax=Phormidium tenue NIES-30 TaxID=549789 RepID=A0A1U7JBV9_9CYAN|nr:transglutaminase family protein [Phormidium tenue]MBD2230410.1 transglutaminase family protein [Phormidium tenue FACHB-1052]OKH51223.1 transglutaminase [Phormidium tenue NIES-30]
MRYQIRHLTRYCYQQPVTLRPHTLRLRPRSDGAQQLRHFTLEVTPKPTQQSAIADTDGNSTVGLWFAPHSIEQFEIITTAEVETYRTNPFDYLAEPWATTLPLDYPTSLRTTLLPYLASASAPALGPGVVDLAQALAHQVEGNVGLFLTALVGRIYETCKYTNRPTGAPWPGSITWGKKLGSCRDFAVLFMEACQAVGIAARFVSGYEQGDSASRDRDLHAWAEAYVPGGGWRAFDPTHGLAVSDRHIALVASPFPAQTLPISGTTQEGSQVGSSLETEIRVEVLEE